MDWVGGLGDMGLDSEGRIVGEEDEEFYGR